jgi:hypothetical protein
MRKFCRYCANQSANFKPGTRLYSQVLLLASVSVRERACATLKLKWHMKRLIAAVAK